MTVRIPSYRLHKPSGRAVVTVNGRDFYLGPYGSAESRQAYGNLIAKQASGISLDPSKPGGDPSGLDVNELVLAFLRHAKTHYQKNGEVTDEYDCVKSAAAPLVHLYGDTASKDFGPLALKAVRERMIGLAWFRWYINKSVQRIRRIFRFGVENELIEPAVLQRLEAVAPLLEGRTDAVELAPRAAVPQDRIDAVRAHVNERTRDMIDLALLTGARPGELVALTGAMLDRRGDVWTATLADHKMLHMGRKRVLAFGPRALLILRKYLKADPGLRLFPIARATFSNNIKAACDRLGITRFTGHWLRHNAATEIRKSSGLDAAQVVLGHSRADTTQIYAHLDSTRLLEIARLHG